MESQSLLFILYNAKVVNSLQNNAVLHELYANNDK